MRSILVDVDRCSGCRLCETVCSFAHEGQFMPSTSRITVVKEDGFGFDLPVLCCHCSRCNAMESCPAGALKRGARRLICVDEEKCTGCGKCVEACRLDAIKLHPTKRTPLICDQCGGKPLCVEKCPTKALTYAETKMSQSRSSSRVLAETLRRWRLTV